MPVPYLQSSSNVLVTGVTGLIGGEIVRTLVRRKLGRLRVLVRPGASAGPHARFVERMRRSGDSEVQTLAAGVEVLPGDVREPLWGLRPGDRERIQNEVDVLVHCAADTSFLGRQSVRDTNVTGMRNLIDLAYGCRRSPLIVYLSTATNVGKIEPHCCLNEEAGCRPDNEHFNDYTRSKAVAESLLRDSGLPMLTLRPSIVLSAGLPDPEFAQQILWFVPLLRVFDCVPLGPDMRLDLVPVAYVVEAAVDLACKPKRRHDCYHLSAGDRFCTTPGRLNEIVTTFYRRRKPLGLMPLSEWTREVHRAHVRNPRQRKIFFALRYYLPFLNLDVVFDNRRLEGELGELSTRITPTTDYFADLLRLIKSKRAMMEAARP